MITFLAGAAVGVLVGLRLAAMIDEQAARAAAAHDAARAGDEAFYSAEMAGLEDVLRACWGGR